MTCITLPALQAQATIDSPLGPLTLAASANGLAGLWFDGQAHRPTQLQAGVDADQPHIARAIDQLARYWRGALDAFDLPLDFGGSTFQRSVWQALRGVRRGRTTGYGEIARSLGVPRAARAVGAAVGRNPLSIVIPCHRVLGHGGALTGYAGGLARKQALLRLEGALAPAAR